MNTVPSQSNSSAELIESPISGYSSSDGITVASLATAGTTAPSSGNALSAAAIFRRQLARSTHRSWSSTDTHSVQSAQGRHGTQRTYYECVQKSVAPLCHRHLRACTRRRRSVDPERGSLWRERPRVMELVRFGVNSYCDTPHADDNNSPASSACGTSRWQKAIPESGVPVYAPLSIVPPANNVPHIICAVQSLDQVPPGAIILHAPPQLLPPPHVPAPPFYPQVCTVCTIRHGAISTQSSYVANQGPTGGSVSDLVQYTNQMTLTPGAPSSGTIYYGATANSASVPPQATQMHYACDVNQLPPPAANYMHYGECAKMQVRCTCLLCRQFKSDVRPVLAVTSR